MLESKYDVTIIGGGPSGSTCGFLLSKQGLRVAIIDKARFPREKLCGGLLTLKTLRIVEQLFHETKHSLTRNKIINFQSYTQEGFFRNRRLSRNSTNFPFCFVDRRVYDNYLLKKAKKAGADVLEGETPFINHATNTIMISNGRTWKTKYIIGADGANSKTRRSLFAEPQHFSSWRKNLATALEVYIEKRDLPESVNSLKIFFGFINWGYCWIFPNSDRIVVGLGGLNRKNGKNFVACFQDFLHSMGLAGQKTSVIRGHPVPYGNFLETPVCGKTLLVGDAAGFVDPILGEGIFYAHKTAQLASAAIIADMQKTKNLQTAYQELLNDSVLPQLKAAIALRRIIFNRFNTYSQFIAVQILLNLFNEKMMRMIHEENSYRWFKN